MSYARRTLCSATQKPPRAKQSQIGRLVTDLGKKQSSPPLIFMPPWVFLGKDAGLSSGLFGPAVPLLQPLKASRGARASTARGDPLGDREICWEGVFVGGRGGEWSMKGCTGVPAAGAPGRPGGGGC